MTRAASDFHIFPSQWFYSALLGCDIPRWRWWPFIGLGVYSGVCILLSAMSFMFILDGAPGKAYPIIHWPLMLLFGRWPW